MYQMLKCRCRSLGVACGRYFTYAIDRTAHLEDILKALQPDYKEGAKLLELLYLANNDLNPPSASHGEKILQDLQVAHEDKGLRVRGNGSVPHFDSRA